MAGGDVCYVLVLQNNVSLTQQELDAVVGFQSFAQCSEVYCGTYAAAKRIYQRLAPGMAIFTKFSYVDVSNLPEGLLTETNIAAVLDAAGLLQVTSSWHVTSERLLRLRFPHEAAAQQAAYHFHDRLWAGNRTRVRQRCIEACIYPIRRCSVSLMGEVGHQSSRTGLAAE